MPNTSTNNPQPEAYDRLEVQKPGKPVGLFSTIPYYFLAFLVLLGIITRTNPFYLLLFVFVILPLMDIFGSQDWLNPDKTQTKELQDDVRFKIPLYVTTFLMWFVEYGSLWYVVPREFPWYSYFGIIFLLGTLSSTNFLIAHELFHKTDKLGRIVGTITMAKNLYMHFFIEHNWGHHKRVATLEDPATSRYGETLYEFLPRTIIGSWKSAWHIECERLVKFKGHKNPFNIENRMIWFAISNFVMPYLVYLRFGFKGMILFICFAVFSIIFLEAINYIEHYGLLREKINGEYEKRHSDHHENAYKPYQTLLTLEESPMLPHGYSLSILASFFPSTWFRMMNPVLKAHKERRKLTSEEKKGIDLETRNLLIKLAVIFGIPCIATYYRIGWSQ